jgi:hypothetical protein
MTLPIRVTGTSLLSDGEKYQQPDKQRASTKGGTMADIIKRDEIAGTQEQSLAELDPSGSAAREVAEIQAAYIMALRKPRDEKKCSERLVAACRRESFADEAQYEFPRGDNQVSGPSAPFAREAARIWGNFRFGLKIIREDDDTRTIKGWALDLETNAYDEGEDHFKKLVQRRRKNPATNRTETVWVTPDERDLRELTNRRGAILIRNAILSLIPKDIIDEALATADDTVRVNADANRPEMIGRIKQGYLKAGVAVAELEAYLGHSIDAVTKDEILDLRKILRAIVDGVSRKEEYFGANAPKRTETGNLDLSKMQAGDPDRYDDHKSFSEQAAVGADMTQGGGQSAPQERTENAAQPRSKGGRLF